MNKISISVKESILAVLCLAAAIGIRIFFMISGDMAITDEFQYFQASMVQSGKQEPVMTSGIVFAYTETLSRILKFTGNRMNIIPIYHMVLQTVSFLFLYAGCYFFFGRTAAFLEMLLLAFSPSMITAVFQVSPENYYLIAWSFVLLLISLFYKRTKEKGWYRSNWDEFYLMLTGFLLGVICIWHYTGFFLIVFILYAIVRNSAVLKERRDAWKGAYAMESLLEQEDSDDEKAEIMPAFSQIFILAAGMFLGGYSTLMKYTGVTGNYIKEQTGWWIKQLFRTENGRWQDLSVWFLLWLILAIVLGAGAQAGIAFIYTKKKENELDKAEMKVKAAEDTEQEVPEEVKMEEKKVNYIENPLPLPKKHVKRALDFKLDGKQDEFDVEINEDDDFDL